MSQQGADRSVPRHTSISASAGSGKTFALAHRYLALMARGVHPDRMVAMTFSRKAAGEIFDEIVKYLCRAAGCAEEARATALRIGRPSLGCADFLLLLRRLVDSLHRARIGTLDSFTVSVIRAFPMELGVAPGVRVMDVDGSEARAVRREILGRIFSRHGVSAAARRDFLEAFKQATFGREEKGMERNLDRLIARYRAAYQAVPRAEAWGVPETIWPDPPDWLAPVTEVEGVARDLLVSLEDRGLPENVMRRWRAFCAALRTYGVESPWTREVEYLFEKLAAETENLRGGEASVRIERTECVLNRRQCEWALRLVRHVMGTEIGRALARTQGMFRILDRYEQVYDRLARSRGRLTFDDLQFLLTESNLHSGGKVLSRRRGEEAKLYIDYRLDCRLDHWLLDEFQDTSDLQWEALSNLVDEVLQDGTGERSFFYVGDVKQAIYGWRGGNAKLFHQLLDRYRDRIVPGHLDASYRSCPPVVETVNRVFSRLPGGALPQGAIDAWSDIWREHTCAEPLQRLRGAVELIEPPCDGGETKSDAAERFGLVASIVREIEPLKRGLSVAVLVRKNDSGRAVVDLLRRECRGVTVVHEGKGPITDNPPVAALLSLVKLAEHPGDGFARGHVRMTPLKGAVEKLEESGDLALRLLRRIHAGGFQAFVRHWVAEIERACPVDDFGRLRLNDLIEAAGLFDEGGGGSCADFLAFVRGHEIRDLAVEGAVTVMTVHQSKGLGFDVVILPELMSGAMDRAGDVGLVTRRDPGSNLPIWLLDMPRRTITENDREMRDAMLRRNEDACFESLCVLYVAMTRARRALYMITSYPGKASVSMTPAALLKTQLTGHSKPVTGEEIAIGGARCVRLYRCGDPDWYREVSGAERKPEAGDAPLPDDFAARPSRRVRLSRVAPSRQDAAPHSAGWLFAGENREVLRFGRAIHELFEAIEWMEEADVEGIIARWLAGAVESPEVKRDVCDQFRRATADAAVRRALSRPPGNPLLWREKRFESVLEGRWITGVFDRVVIGRDAAGAPAEAAIVDYKSNRIAAEAEFAAAAESYRPQLDLYGRALSGTLCLPEARIRKQIVFTRAGRVVEL